LLVVSPNLKVGEVNETIAPYQIQAVTKEAHLKNAEQIGERELARLSGTGVGAVILVYFAPAALALCLLPQLGITKSLQALTTVDNHTDSRPTK
jgi:hypothetical protein